jgi:hypothetical protein
MIAALFTFLFFYFDGSFVSFAEVEEKENQSTSGSRAKSLARAHKSEKSSWSNSKLDGLHRHHHLEKGRPVIISTLLLLSSSVSF